MTEDRCKSAQDTWSELHKIAFYDLPDMLGDATLDELNATKLGCSERCFRLSVLEFAIWGGAKRTFKMLVQKGMTYDPAAWMEATQFEAGSHVEITPCPVLRGWLERGYVDIQPGWAVVRLLFIGEREASSAFGLVPKDVVKLIAHMLTQRVHFWTAK